MKPDMHKIIVERGRRGGGYWPRPWRLRGLDGGPTKEGMNRLNYGQRKELSDNLEPLRRWLWKQHGRPWNRVYSELCRALPRGVHRYHVDSHLRQWVDALDHSPFRFRYLSNTYDMNVNAAGILRRNPCARKRLR